MPKILLGKNQVSPFDDVLCQTIKEVVRESMSKDLTEDNLGGFPFLSGDGEKFQASLPLLSTRDTYELDGTISFFAIYHSRPGAFKFFFEMISQWLIPGRRVDTPLVYAADFKIQDHGKNSYTICVVKIQIGSVEDRKMILNHLPNIEPEIRLGLESGYYARRTLEIKGLSNDLKTALIQEYIAGIIKKNPRNFDAGVMSEMQHILVLCTDEYKAERSSRHLSRIMLVGYMFRKRLLMNLQEAPQRRHLYLKVFKEEIGKEGLKKNILGLMVGINFLADKEVFEQKHLLSAIQNYIPEAKAVEGSFLYNRRGHDALAILYLEILKADNSEITSEEIRTLRRELPTDVKDRIQHLMHPVFMPRNEEEIMRNVLTLSTQIKFPRDIPQVHISFDEQTQSNLFFNVILVRVVMPGSSSIQDIFGKANTPLGYIHDRCKMLGYLRKKYTKEATIFRVKLPKEKFLRRDHSIDLNKARQEVVTELSCIIGEVRDYNGGMISKQNELLHSVRKLLQDTHGQDELLLENFFYSLNPVIMRTVLEPYALKSLFSMMLDSIEDNEKIETHSLRLKVDPSFVFAIVRTEEPYYKEELNKALSQLHLHSSELASSFVKVQETGYLGYIYRCNDPQRQQQFCQQFQNIVSNTKCNIDFRQRQTL